MTWRAGCTALLFLAVLELGLLTAIVQSCGHHVVHGDIKSMVAMHLKHQSAHPHSGAWGPVELAAGVKGQDLHHHLQQQLSDNGSGGDDAEKHDPHGDSNGADEHQGYDYRHHDHAADGGEDLYIRNGVEDTAESRDADGEWVKQQRRRLQQNGMRQLLQTSSVPSPAPLRLAVTYQRLDALDASQQEMLTRVVQAVRRILQKFILVKSPPSGGMLVDPYCLEYYRYAGCTLYYPDFTGNTRSTQMCGLATVLPQHVVRPENCSQRVTSIPQVLALNQGSAGPASGAGNGSSAYGTGCSSYAGTQGEATDMYLYITAVQNDDCNAGAAAWARPCLLDLGNNRPLLGAANICPRALNLLDEDSLTAVLAHEMIHALGFTDSMFNLTRRADGSPRPMTEVVASVTVGGKTVNRLVTPGVRDAARAHFGCPSLNGAQLEDEGSAGSAGSHWEYTHYQGEVMVASTIFAADGSPPALSNMTLSYLEDTGWYVANRSAMGLLSWGTGAGCALPTSSCSQYMAAMPDQNLFCDPSTATNGNGSLAFHCTSTFKSTGVCRTLNFTGGCGLLLSNNAVQTCTGPDATTADMPDVFGWGTGTTSGRCFPVVYRFQAVLGNNRYTFPASGRDGDIDASCFDTTCSADGTKVYVKMFGQSFECPEGEYLSLPQLLPTRYNAGRIGPCPSAQDICSTQSCPAGTCNSLGGDCLNGTCYCHLAYTGSDCSYNLITGQAVPNIDDSSSTSTAVGTTVASSPPPPPSVVWTQVVQLSLSLYTPRAQVAAGVAQYQSILATWAQLDVSKVRVASVAAPLGVYNTSSSSSSSGAAGTQAGDSFDATAANSSGSSPPVSSHRRRRGRQALAVASPPPSMLPPPSPSLLPPPSPSPPPPPAVNAVVTALLTPGSSRGVTILLSMLQDTTQMSQLTTSMAAGGFVVLPGSASVQTLVMQVMDTGSTTNTAVSTSTSGDASRGKTVIIIAIVAAGVAVAGIIAAVIAVMVVRTRRAKQDFSSIETRRAQRYALRADRHGSGGGGGSSNSSRGGAAPFAPPETSTAQYQPIQGYPAAAPTGTWPAPGYGTAAGAPGTNAAAYSYYSARAAALAQPSAGQLGTQPPAAAPAPLYAGPQ